MRSRPGGVLLGVVVAFSMAATAPAQDETRPRPQRQFGPELIELDHSDISPPLRDIKIIPPSFQDNEDHPVKPLPHHHPFPPLRGRTDPVLQLFYGTSRVSTTPGLSFDGV